MAVKINRFNEHNSINESVLAGLVAAGLVAAGVGIFGGPAAEGVGKILGKIKSGLPRFGSIIGKTGKDEDLAEEIHEYLKRLPLDYISSTDFNYNRVYMPLPGTFVFFGKIFQKDQVDYRIDVICTSDMKIKDLDENPYRIIISKLVRKPTGYIPFSKYKGGIGANDPGLPPNIPNLLITANPKADEEMIQLECSLVIGRKIYEKCAEIWQKTHPNTKGAARGGQNTTTPQPRGSGRNPSSRNQGLFRRWTW